ncbi:hypothetical protein, partial [Enterobacter roggenkampii]|uniref:hypothetical protein n=1 Tax=Enterobacter roggenkampii TaxID=1812935 RepID=UPI003D6F73C6
NTDDLFVGKTLLHGDVLMWLMKTLLTSGCTNQRGAGHYRLNVITDETGQTHKIDPNSVSVTSPYSAEMAQKNETQLRSAPESYQSDSMVTVTDFPNYTIQGYENGPVTRCAILSKHE